MASAAATPGLAAPSGPGSPVGPAARDLFAEGLFEFLRPAVRQLDSHVHAVRWAEQAGVRQVQLRHRLTLMLAGTLSPGGAPVSSVLPHQ